MESVGRHSDRHSVLRNKSDRRSPRRGRDPAPVHAWRDRERERSRRDHGRLNYRERDVSPSCDNRHRTGEFEGYAYQSRLAYSRRVQEPNRSPLYERRREVSVRRNLRAVHYPSLSLSPPRSCCTSSSLSCDRGRHGSRNSRSPLQSYSPSPSSSPSESASYSPSSSTRGLSHATSTKTISTTKTLLDDEESHLIVAAGDFLTARCKTTTFPIFLS